MGGKPKQTQRTKNNSRPSNSGRSAELFGTSMPAFVGFTSLAMCGTDVPVLPGFQTSANSPEGLLDDIDVANVDTNYQLVLRKMTKKDPVTKVKALAEFIELCNASDVDAVVAILPFWPRLYANLASDMEHRVREACQQAQAAVAVKCGKQIAPYLRQLAPSWITSQFDTYAPAASLATQSFQKSFKPAKQQEVFTYCQTEFLEYVARNVTVVTAASMSTANRTYTPEECEAKYQRLVTGSLKGYSQYLSRLSAEQLADAADRNLAIIAHAKFWTYYKSKVTTIRAAWFETLSAILQHAPQFIQSHEKEATTAAIQTLDETEPIVLPHVWSAVLLVTQTVPQWTQYVNMEKALLPKLWKVLKTGGAGSAAVIHPHLLPLLSKLNAEAIGAGALLTFYTDFFAHMNTGLVSRVGHQSRSDTTAISTAYFECVRYVLIKLQSTGESDELHTFSQRLVDDHLIAVVSWTLSADVTGAKHVYAAIGALVGYWTQHADATPLYALVLAHFWPALQTTLERVFADTDDERIAKVLRLQYELLHELRAGQQQSTRAARPVVAKVQFSAPAADAVDSASTPDAEKTAAAAAAAAAVAATPKRRECDELALRLCTVYMKKATEKLSPHFVDSVENLFKSFGNAAFFARLGDGNINKLYDKISVWLLIAQLRQENVVDILLQLYAHLEAADERQQLLSKLLKFPNEAVQSWLIVRLLSHPLCAEPTVPALLAQPNVRHILFASADRIVAGDTSANVNFLHKCFFQNEAGEILIDAQTCRGIVERLVAALRSEEESGCEVLDTCASFLAQIMPVICCDGGQRELQQLLFVAFFEFSVRREVGEHLTQDTLWEITTSWQDALSSGDMTLSDELLAQCAAIVERKLAEDDGEVVSVENIENTAEMVAKLILCSVERLNGEEDGGEVKVGRRTDEIVERMFDSRSNAHRSRLAYVEHVCLYAGAIGGELSVPDIGSRLGTAADVRSVRTVDSFMKLAAFRFDVIFKITCTVKQSRGAGGRTATAADGGDDQDDANDDDEDEYTEDFCDASENLLKRFSERIVDEIVAGIYVASMADTLLPRSCSWSANTELQMLHLTEKVPLYLRNVTAAYVPVIRDRLFAETRSRGLLWSASVLWLTNVAPYDDVDNGLTVLREQDELTAASHVSKDVYVNVLQTFAGKSAPRLLPIECNLFVDDVDANLFVKCATLRCLIENYTQGDTNDADDRLIMESSKSLLNSLYLECKRDKQYFLYNEDISNTASERVVQIAEIANFYAAVLRAYPHRLESNDWDLIRIAVSSWVLSVSKTSEHALQSPKVAVFAVAVYRLFNAFQSFIAPLVPRSGTHLLTTVTTEWNDLFAKDVNLILLKCYLKFVTKQRADQLTDQLFVDLLSQHVAHIDHRHVLAARRIDSKTSLDDLIEFALANLSHSSTPVRVASAGLLRSLAAGLIAIDVAQLAQRQSTDDDHVDVSPEAAASRASNTWHVLHKFAATLQRHESAMNEYTDEFSFKTNELDNLREVPRAIALPFLLLWDAVLDLCAKASAELRSIYATYLTAGDAPHVQRMLVTLFRLMPVELLRNQDAKHIGQTYFAPLTDAQLAAAELTTRRLACHTYVRALRHLPAAVRKWWHDAAPAQKTLVDKLTTSFVSAQLCQDELRALVDKRGGAGAAAAENMQLTVHTSTREVIATYVIDEARMELIVTLPVNHPLGAVRVDSGKQIGGRMQSRVLVMQLTIFLTHQNGSISDGLSLWKRNLDRKFEGVQECYVCYSVIHQDTCQLPKLSCRKCKNKFHGPCLYKWFSTSNKSTCPICRSIF